MTDSQLLILADTVLVVHFAIALFITWSLPVVWVGALLKKRFVHNPWFRLTHAGMMVVVLLESLAGVLCPLTTWEAALRHAAGGGSGDGQSFVGYWVGRFLFHDFSETAYTIAYGLFFLVVVGTFLLVPIRWKDRKKRSDHSAE